MTQFLVSCDGERGVRCIRSFSELYSAPSKDPSNAPTPSTDEQNVRDQ